MTSYQCLFQFVIDVVLIIYCLTSHSKVYFIHIETSPLPVKGWIFFAFALCLWRLNSEGSLSCHACIGFCGLILGTDPLVALHELGLLRTLSNPDIHFAGFFEFCKQVSEMWVISVSYRFRDSTWSGYPYLKSKFFFLPKLILVTENSKCVIAK